MFTLTNKNMNLTQFFFNHVTWYLVSKIQSLSFGILTWLSSIL
jgi:hypothetical protein